MKSRQLYNLTVKDLNVYFNYECLTLNKPQISSDLRKKNGRKCNSSTTKLVKYGEKPNWYR